MSLIRAKEYLKKFDLDDKVMEFDVSSATVAEAAKAIGCSAGEIAKTISFLAGEKVVLIVTAGDYKIDNSKYKLEFGTKAKMLAYEDVERFIGHSVGGVCPFGVKDGVEIYLDNSLKKYEYVYPACGSSNSAIKLSVSELERVSGSIKWVDVCKLIENNI